MTFRGATYDVKMGFTSSADAVPDPDRPSVMQARRRSAPAAGGGVEVRLCEAIDWSDEQSVRPDLCTFGFDLVDLADLEPVQRACLAIRQEADITDASAAAMRAALQGAVLPCSSGRRLKVLHVAEEGLILRVAGPNRLPVAPTQAKNSNTQGPATAVHADQDVHGTPLAQLMDGRAPSLFRHDSPDGHNHDASLMLVNLWIPLHQITQPLVLGDGRSLDRPRHQLRFGLATDSFLNRESDQVVNDIWTFCHHPDQRWYFRSEMDHREAYVFDTLSTAHGSAVLPGEDVAERLYLALERVEAVSAGGDRPDLTRVLDEVGPQECPERVTPALADAIAEMADLLDEARGDPARTFGGEATSWSARSRTARGRVVRTSVEMRLVVSVEP